MKLMYTKNEPEAKPVNEPKTKPYYTEFMFVDDEINVYIDVDEIDDKHFEPEAEPEDNELNEPEAEPEYDYPKYRIYELPKFAEYYDEAFNHDCILKDVNCGK